MAEARIHDVWLVRHGETEWTISRQHTGSTDIELTDGGIEQARALLPLLAGQSFALVLSSPLQRARRTAEVAGLSPEIEPGLVEFDYGEYEGLTTAEIKSDHHADWDLWDHGSPGGETAADVGARVDRVVARVRAADGPCLLFGHGHTSRVVAARLLGLEPGLGRIFKLDPGTVSIIGVEHGHPAIRLWNSRSVT